MLCEYSRKHSCSFLTPQVKAAVKLVSINKTSINTTSYSPNRSGRWSHPDAGVIQNNLSFTWEHELNKCGDVSA